MDIGDIVDIEGDAVDVANGQIVQFGDAARRVVESDDVLELADLLGSDRRYDVLPRDRLDHVLRRQPVSLQLVLVEVDLDLQHLAAIWRGDRRPGDSRELWTDEVLSGVENLGLGKVFAR